MKILYLCGGNLAKKRGYTVHTTEVARNLKALGADILIFAPSLGHVKEEDLKIKYVPTVNIKILRPVSFRIALSIMTFWQLFIHKPDIIYVREIPLYLAPFVLGRVFKKPTIIEINNAAIPIHGFSAKSQSLFFLLKFYMRKVSFILADKIIAANQNVKDILAKKYGIDKKKFVVIPMGANISLFRPIDKHKCRDMLNLKKDYRYVTFTGTLYPFQGLEYLVEAAPLILKKNKNIKFLIVGSGVHEKNLKNLIRKRNMAENFIFAGEREYSTVPYYINSSDLCVSFVTPERSETFSFPIKIYEYLSCGRPVVIGNVRNASELLNKKLTPVINATDPAVLSKAIIETLECTDRLEDESNELRRLVAEDYTWKKTSEKTLELFSALLHTIKPKGKDTFRYGQ